MKYITEVLDYPIVIVAQVKESLIYILDILKLLSKPYLNVLLLGIITFVLSVIIVPLTLTALIKPEESKSYLKHKIKKRAKIFE